MKKKNLYFPRAKLDAYSTYFQYKFTYEIPDARYRNYNTEILPEDNLVYWEKRKRNLFKRKIIELKRNSVLLVRGLKRKFTKI